MERILCSAILFDDGKEHVHQPKNIVKGFVVSGRRHHNCFATAFMIPDCKDLKGKNTQGFLTSSDRFVDRYEAFFIAEEAGQLLLSNVSGKEKQALISEDLW